MAKVRITTTDLDTNESESVEIEDDYVLTTVGRYYLHHVQKFANGTHILTVRRGPADE